MARRVSNLRVLAAVTSVKTSLGDPRIPINFAEAAGFAGLVKAATPKASPIISRQPLCLSLACKPQIRPVLSRTSHRVGPSLHFRI